MDVKHRNIEVPNSLAANGPLAPLSNQPCLSLQYKRGDILVYIDPITHDEVYGRVESEWDFRNSEAAPSLIRGGDGALTHYIIRYLGPVTPLILHKLEKGEDPTVHDMPKEYTESKKERKALLQSLPILEGVKSVNLRAERVLANKIDKRLNLTKYLRLHGPMHHLNPPIPRGFVGDLADDDDNSQMISESSTFDIPNNNNNNIDNNNDNNNNNNNSNDGNIGDMNGNTNELLNSSKDKNAISRIGSVVSNASHVKSTRPLTLVELRTQSLPHPVASKRTLEGIVAAYSLIAEVESKIYPHLPPYDISDELPLLERRQKVIVLPESALTKPSDQVKLMAIRKKEKIRVALNKRFSILFNDWLKFSFHHWIEWNHDYTRRIQSISALKIQTQFRRWLCKVISYYLLFYYLRILIFYLFH